MVVNHFCDSLDIGVFGPSFCMVSFMDSTVVHEWEALDFVTIQMSCLQMPKFTDLRHFRHNHQILLLQFSRLWTIFTPNKRREIGPS